MSMRKTIGLGIWTILAFVSPTLVLAGENAESLDLRTHHDNVKLAYETASRENKYLLLLVTSVYGEVAQMRDSLKSKELAQFSDQWIVCDTDPSRDPHGDEFVERFNIEMLPSLVLIKTTAASDSDVQVKDVVVCRIVKYQSHEKTSDFFTRAMHEYEKRGKVLDVLTYHDQVFDGWETAKREGKYFLFICNAEYSGFSQRTVANMTDPRMAKYADDLIVVDTDPEFDTDAELFMKRFDVKKYPTLLILRPILDPKTNKVKGVDLVGRMSGEQTAKEMDDYLQPAFEKYEDKKRIE